MLISVISCQSLKTLCIEKNRLKIEELSFLKNIINPSVRNFSYSVSQEDTKVLLFRILVKKFPRLEKIKIKTADNIDNDVCFEEGTNLKMLKSLTMINSCVRSLLNINAENLEHFEYVPGKSGQCTDNIIGAFLHRHRGIKHLTIGSSSMSSSYFFVSSNLCELFVNFLTDLQSITIYNFGEINRSVRVLSTLSKLKTLTLDRKQYLKFTKKTKDMCEKANLKLIPIDDII